MAICLVSPVAAIVSLASSSSFVLFMFICLMF
jgi:hypothetical protein